MGERGTAATSTAMSRNLQSCAGESLRPLKGLCFIKLWLLWSASQSYLLVCVIIILQLKTYTIKVCNASYWIHRFICKCPYLDTEIPFLPLHILYIFCKIHKALKCVPMKNRVQECPWFPVAVNLSYLWNLLLNKQSISSNTLNNSGQQKSQNTLSLKIVLRLQLLITGHCEMGTQGYKHSYSKKCSLDQ